MSKPMKMRQIAGCIALIFAVTSVAQANDNEENHKKSKSPVKVKIVAINDFHGQLESPGSLRNVPATPALPNPLTTPVGGIDWIAAYIADLKNKNPNTTFVSAGDLIGATPLISALFHDEGTIETMNRAGLDINAVGNHEFDEGKDELLRMQKGGCHPTDENSCQGDLVGTPVPFEGADFKFLAANVVETATGKTIFPSYVIKEYDDVKVAFIGLTLKETPSIVTPTGVAGLEFKDEAATINALIPKLHRKGAKVIVVLIHQGGTIPVAQAVSTINSCDGNLAGSPIKDIVNQLSNSVDLVISGHTHQAYNCLIATKDPSHLIPVTSANSQGRVLTDIDVVIDARSGKARSINPVNVVVDRTNATIAPDADIKLIVDNYKTLVQPIANRIIGSITATLSRTANAAGESAMGDVIADAQLAATKAAGFGDAVVAFMNPGGVRADLTFASSSAGEGDGNVTFGEAFTVQPFGNSLVTLTLTGAQIEELLEQQFTGCLNNQPFNRILSVSEGFSYEWDSLGAACDKINPAKIKINGIVVDPGANYRVTVNSFLADGGDNFKVLLQGGNRLGGAQDSDALEAYFTANSPVSPGVSDRILRLP
jgi:5'-nucleotidase